MSYLTYQKKGDVFFKKAEEVESKDPITASRLYLEAARNLWVAYKLCDDNALSDLYKKKALEAKRRSSALVISEPNREAIGKAGEYGQSNEIEALIDEFHSQYTLDDVKGMKEVKETLEYLVIAPITDKDFTKFVKNETEGFLLYGPPGSGKTYLTMALAGELEKYRVHTYFVTAADILSSWVGESEKRMRQLFEEAIANQPSVIIIDEADGILGKRSGKEAHADRLVNQFLTMYTLISGEKVYVILTSNHPWKIDSAVLREGRVGRHIYIGLPDYEARKELFKHYLKGVEKDKNINYKLLAEKSEGLTSSEIASVCKLAGIRAYKEYKRGKKSAKITSNLLLEEIERVERVYKSWKKEAEENGYAIT